MFIIIRRHYDLIMRQSLMNYPEESGGLLGGRHGVIMGVYPTFNWADKKVKHREFGLSAEDAKKAKDFFAQYDLEYVGTYHTHPKGAPTPSAQDLSHQQEKHLMIIGLSNPQSPVVTIFENRGGMAFAEPLKIIEDHEISLFAPAGSNWRITEHEKQMTQLESFIEAMIEDRKAYKLQPPRRFGSSFSVEA